MVQAPDLVAGLRASADVAAAAAAATGRTARLADRPADLLCLLERVEAASVLVVPGPELGVAGAMAIARTGAVRGVPVGFVATWMGRDSAERQLGKLCRPPRAGRETDLVFAQLGFAPLTGRGGAGRLSLLAGTDAGVVERLSAPHRLLAVAAYGSAADAEVGRAYVCGRGAADGGPGGRPWPCHLGGLCLERHRAGAAPDRVVRIDPRTIAADCVIWGVCGAVALSGSVVAPPDSVVAGFLGSERCGPVIAPCKVTDLDHGLLLFGAGLVRAGVRLGEVALQLNRASLAGSSADTPWLLLGDPAARLAPPGPAAAAIPAEGLDLTVRAGELRLLRHDPADAVVTWESPGEDAAALSRRLLVGQLPGTGHAMALLVEGDPATLTLGARRPGALPAELAQALSIWTGAGPYAALRRLLGAAARILGSRDAADLEDQLLDWSRATWAHLGAGARLRMLDRLTPSPAECAAADRRRWATLHRSALEHLAALLERSPAALGYLHRTSAPAAAWRALDAPCSYCGAPLEESRYRVDGSPEARARVRCARCGPVSDAPAGAGVLRIDAEDPVEPGGALRWSIALPATGSGWRYRAAAVAFEPVPWPLAEAATSAAGWDEPGGGALAGAVTLRRDVPHGLYGCVAVALVQGEPYLARRFVRVGASGVAPRA